MCRVTFSAIEIKDTLPAKNRSRPAKIEETCDSNQGEGGTIPCICGGGRARHQVITSELMGVGLPKAWERDGNYCGSICTCTFTAQ